jgi:predicted alpha/beta superfamily hydrolase
MTRKFRKIIITFFCFFLLLSEKIAGQKIDIHIGKRDSIQSTVLKENRKFIIHLPKEYDTSKKSYPVLYLLDGSEKWLLFNISLINYYFNEDIIIVSVENTNRDRDMMPISAPSYPATNPGADNFLSFIRDELMPFAEKGLRTNGQKMVSGKSLSGVFVLYALMKQPQLFDIYIANSVGWFNDMEHFFLPLVDKAFQSAENYKGKRIFFANSEIDNPDILKSMETFSKKIADKLGKQVNYRYETYSKFGHVPYPAYYDAIKFVFESKKN